VERDLSQFVAAVKRIPLFEGLTADQAMVLLRACERRPVKLGEAICSFGDQSAEMFILLSGALSVRSNKGFQIARIAPVSPVGEMGIFTGEPRSATVVCSEDSTFLVLAKGHLQHLLRRHPDIELIVSRRLIGILSQRIRDANQELSHLRDVIADQEAGVKAAQDEELEGPDV
jgi:CRP-like cAMP-binding protein